MFRDLVLKINAGLFLKFIFEMLICSVLFSLKKKKKVLYIDVCGNITVLVSVLLLHLKQPTLSTSYIYSTVLKCITCDILISCFFLLLPAFSMSPFFFLASHYLALTFFLLAGIIPPVGDFKVQAGQGKALITHLPWNSSQITTRPSPSDSALLPPSD